MEPAKTIIQKLGGHANVRAYLGLGETATYRWCHAKDKGGCAGIIPSRYIKPLMQMAREKGVSLRHEDFFAAETV